MKIDIGNYCSPDNASLGVKKAVDNAKSGDTLFFQKNEYHFYKDFSESRLYHMSNTDSFEKPEKYFAILIEDKENITINGNGSKFVIHGDICALALVRCKNIILKDFTIRYNSPTNFEMTVLEKHGRSIKYSVAGRDSFCVKRNNIFFYEQSPFSKKKYYEFKNSPKSYCNVLHIGDEVYRTQLSPVKNAVNIKRIGENEVICKYIFPPKLIPGETIAMSNNRCRANCGIFFWECSNIKSENLSVNYMHGFGWLSQMCENLSFNNIRFEPAKGYKVSSFADLIHICSCKGYVKIDKCFFSHPNDDGINIHGVFLRLKSIIDKHTAVFEFAHRQQGGYSAVFNGNKIKFYSRKDLSEVRGIYTVKNCENDIKKKTVKIHFEEELPKMKKRLYVCENITYNPEVTISNCTFKAIPTRGILCTTDKPSEIFENRFINTKMADIYISCDCNDWYESGPCKDLKIHDNIFSQKDAVVIEPICLEKPVKNVHENIKIYNNI